MIIRVWESICSLNCSQVYFLPMLSVYIGCRILITTISLTFVCPRGVARNPPQIHSAQAISRKYLATHISSRPEHFISAMVDLQTKGSGSGSDRKKSCCGLHQTLEGTSKVTAPCNSYRRGLPDESYLRVRVLLQVLVASRTLTGFQDSTPGRTVVLVKDELPSFPVHKSILTQYSKCFQRQFPKN